MLVKTPKSKETLLMSQYYKGSLRNVHLNVRKKLHLGSDELWLLPEETRGGMDLDLCNKHLVKYCGLLQPEYGRAFGGFASKTFTIRFLVILVSYSAF